MERALAEYAPDTVFHLAAQSILGIAQRSPLTTWESNVRGTWTVVRRAADHGVARTVVAASHKAYGAHDRLPYREDFELRARYPYDVSKAAADLIARSYWHTYGLPVATTRFTNVYGGGDQHRSRLVPEAIDAALAGRRRSSARTGRPERDFLYVDDAVEAYLAIARALDGEGPRARRSTPAAGAPTRCGRSSSSSARSRARTSSPTSAGGPRRGARSTASSSTPQKLRALTGLGPGGGARGGAATDRAVVPRSPTRAGPLSHDPRAGGCARVPSAASPPPP